MILIAQGAHAEKVLQLMEKLDTLREPPLLLLLEEVDDARNLGFTLRSAEALGVHAVLIKKHLWGFDPVEVARPSILAIGGEKRGPSAPCAASATDSSHSGSRWRGIVALPVARGRDRDGGGDAPARVRGAERGTGAG